MILFKQAAEMRHWLETQQQNGEKLGFVPTMGALHNGHISLVNCSRKENDITVASIFVNPTQFNDPKDYEKYPITIEKDITMLEEAGCDVLFLPSVKEMYPGARPDDMVGRGVKARMNYELGFLETVFDGKLRPGHYQGVCMVVHRLLEIVLPDNLYLGQKDYQQCMVISRLIEIIGLSDKIKVHICPTLRENDGLAMSSRNMRLNTEERKIAPTIYKAINLIQKEIQKGDTTVIINKAKALLQEKGFRIDYVSLADAKNLSAVDNWDGEQKLVVLVAAFLNEVRLIDNMPLS
jgi:pantoate--beta-alanine ligase